MRLSNEDRCQLINTLMREQCDSSGVSIQPKLQSAVKQKGLAASLIGIAKTDAPPPTDEEVNAMLDQRLELKYL